MALADEPGREREDEGHRDEPGDQDRRAAQTRPVGVDGEGGEDERGEEEDVRELGEQAEPDGDAQTCVCARARPLLQPDQGIDGSRAGGEDGDAVGQRLVDGPADRDDQEEREGAERGEPRVGQDPPRREVHQPEGEDEQRVLEEREREESGAEEAEGAPHEPVVEGRLPRLVSPLEALGEHRLARVVRREGRGEREPEERVEAGPREQQGQRPARFRDPRPARAVRRGRSREPRRHGPSLVEELSAYKALARGRCWSIERPAGRAWCRRRWPGRSAPQRGPTPWR